MSRRSSILVAWLVALALVGCSSIGGKPKDTDGDGVEDSKDACLSTAHGAKVDQKGCETDADGDGVPDSRDACPGTPPGTQADANGCDPDRDGDGVTNSRDACPGTPVGAKVDATGCEADADGDGVPDNRDVCPDTPRGAKVDAKGCAQDADADGTPDGGDKCPNTPLGTVVDADGCPRVPDADRDGVADSRDRCSNTPAGDLVDTNGCSALKRTILKGVNFEIGSARLSGEADKTLDSVAQTLIANPNVKVRIGGHTDTTGSSAFNLALSRERAAAVRQYLISKGVNAANLTVVGFAAGEPIGDNATKAGRAANRRVEIKVIRQ